eukprot:m.502529 g.502529  ORF g.502529 m.502529 type:complete len:738 (-) comp67877_c0_seq1:32-2245(-)
MAFPRCLLFASLSCLLFSRLTLGDIDPPAPCVVVVAATGEHGKPLDTPDVPVVGKLHDAIAHPAVVRVGQRPRAVCLQGGVHHLAAPVVLSGAALSGVTVRPLTPQDPGSLAAGNQGDVARPPPVLTSTVRIPSSTCSTSGRLVSCPLPSAASNVQGPSHMTVYSATMAPRLLPARWPFARNEYRTVRSSQYTRPGLFRVTLSAASLPAALLVPGVQLGAEWFPLHSWVNLLGTAVTAQATPAERSKGLAAFHLLCPGPVAAMCTNTSNHLVINVGARVALLHHPSLLLGEAHDGRLCDDDTIHWTLSSNGTELLLDASPSTGQVLVSTNASLLKLHNVQNVVIKDTVFTGTTFQAAGYQEGFNVQATSPGMPHDAAVHVNGSQHVLVSGCSMAYTGGGGITVYNSHDVNITNSTFRHMGQSGIMLPGNDTTQSTRVVVSECTMSWVGEILASAAGILASSVSDAEFAGNHVYHGSRWGIAVRSNVGALSLRNHIHHNVIKHVGLRTRDLGGISLIGQGYTGTVIEDNCVRDVQGHDTDSTGALLTPFFTWSIYLDNWASGFTVRRNILSGNVRGGVFFHGGSDNIVENNILHNASNFQSPGQVAFGTMNGRPGFNNSFVRNVVVFPVSGFASDNTTFLSSYHYARLNTSMLVSDSNLVFKRGTRLEGLPNLTPKGPLAQWQEAGQDRHSLFDVDPLLANPAAGDFHMDPASPAFTKLKFQPLDPVIGRHCGDLPDA